MIDRTRWLMAAAALATMTSGLAALAPSGGGSNFAVDWYTIDGGGGTSESDGGAFVLNGTIGQPDAGVMTGEGFSLSGGFWPGVDAAPAAPCPTDLTGDGMTDGADLGSLLADWGECPGCPTDLNGDGAVDGGDLGLLLGEWGPC